MLLEIMSYLMVLLSVIGVAVFAIALMDFSVDESAPVETRERSARKAA